MLNWNKKDSFRIPRMCGYKIFLSLEVTLSKQNKHQITIVLENCESFTLQEEDVLTFSLDNITRRLQDFWNLNVAESSSIVISPEWCKAHPDDVKRLTDWNDITSFEVQMDDKTEYIFVEYQEAEGMENVFGAENINQSCYTYDDGGLFIMINPKIGKGEMTAKSYLDELWV